MILLDTNVLSELMRAKPDPVVVAWVDAQPVQDLLISSITVAEILYGIARMPEGKRRQALQDVAIAMFEEDFAGRILPFDADAAVHYAELAAESEGKGKIADMADGQIAAIAKLHGVPVATRNIRHFQGFGVELINPWSG
ncbi:MULTISPECIES: type II toxin-antitoxin system VapC family toxin [Pseudomonas aeruginosa group]|uniref:type II toxin-antitoxin system VapC family toxin n=1 Tax=Pseudomonas aeruginosa group TaxID=136841 RepID=UPI00071BED91|nr:MULTISPECIES: type II toxin-antitoxin system VapC family toxin [Pseudomonas aeruginosa group]KSC41394.1 VapC toxin family PIN domain ribonuclease [Pseudomonas paraeruginosa]KSL11146.1 VapC toxin family PIN domain ribonuclease [Pseudomonas aeruginosa]MBH8713292.1 type II toxin-antitoxin system VapC family toxin [Pseudomonas aeruginosa]MBH9342348.1 type II toxin-antitoxin system VapC family toxin [Pseudomonas aeruginosa]MBH9395233.1 type II toxin-antitoxin system VapC family toxin [Pseudomona